MIGAIVGDVVGSVWEGRMDKPEYDFELLPNRCKQTDDSILTIATADSIMNNIPFVDNYRAYYNRYRSNYGGMFRKWARDSNMGPYYSFGNGSGG